MTHLERQNRRVEPRPDANGNGSLTRRAAIARFTALGLAGPALATSNFIKTGAFPRTRPASPAPTGLTHRGMTYDTGWGAATGELSREVWQPAFMEREIAAIRDDLHCTSISVFGTDLGRLRAAATAAADVGLDVWIQPRLTYAPRVDTIEHMAEAARTAEELRRQGASVTLTLGTEHLLFAGEIIPGETFDERVQTLVTTGERYPVYLERVNALLGDAVVSVRSIFGGPVTYGAEAEEALDTNWSIFDIVGLNYYMTAENRATYVDGLRAFRRFGKPIVVTEFGSTSYEGANEAGGMGWDIIDWSKNPPEILPGYVRNEQVQADYIAELLAVYEAEQLHGAFVYTFMEQAPHLPEDPRYDYDMASYGIVKIYEDGSEKSYSQTGYWEPKLAFHEIARIYGAG
jgi:hypothetical protein